MDGARLGYLMEGAETFHSAPWHDGAALHGAGDAAYLAKSVAADTIAYAGNHNQPEIHGGTGKGVEITQGATANGVITANNAVASTTGASDIIRCEFLISIPVTTGASGVIGVRSASRSGTAPTVQFLLNHNASGDITGWNTAISAATTRAGYGEGTPRSDGGKTWFIWFEIRATGVGTVAPALGLSGAIEGRKIVIHDMRIVLNPQTAPKAVPVLAANKSFAADVMVTGATGASGVLFHRNARCRTKITDGRFSIAPGPQRSGPYVPYETRIEVVDSAESTDVQGILPNEFEEIDFTPWLSPTDFNVVLGPGYYNHRVTPASNKASTNLTVTSAFRAEPRLMGQIERITTSPTFLAGKLTLDDLIVFSRASEVAAQFDQGDLPSDTSGTLNTFRAGTDLSLQRSLVVAHPSTHSRARAEAQEDDSDDQRVWIGVNTLLSNTSGSVCNISGSHFWRLGRACYVTMGATAKVMNLTADGVFFDQIWSDCFFVGGGTYNISFNKALFGRTTAAQSDLWQSRQEIEVDTGSGWQALSASGLNVSGLPIGRKATFAGTWDFAGSTFTPAPDTSRHLHVRSWKRGPATGIHDKAGYQWHASQARHPNEDRQCAAGDVYVIEQGVSPSPATPWIRLTFDHGSWANGSTYNTSSSPALLGTGTHPDYLQINRTGCVVNTMTASGAVMLGRAQGMFLTGMAAMGSSDSDIRSAAFDNWIMVSDQSWALAFDWAKTADSTCQISDALTLPMTTRYRYSNGTVPLLGMTATGANNTILLDNVHIGFVTGSTPVSGVSGGTITGSYTQVQVGGISNYSVTPPAGTPKITDMLDSQWLDPFTHAVRGNIDPLDASFSFTPAAESTTGIALNAILHEARGTHARWDGVKAQIASYHRAPDHVVSVSAAAAVGTSVLTGLAATGWKRLYGGNEKGYFTIEDGALKVAKALSGINQCWLLETDREELILVDIG